MLTILQERQSQNVQVVAEEPVDEEASHPVDEAHREDEEASATAAAGVGREALEVGADHSKLRGVAAGEAAEGSLQGVVAGIECQFLYQDHGWRLRGWERHCLELHGSSTKLDMLRKMILKIRS
jgi:hypothetical protein